MDSPIPEAEATKYFRAGLLIATRQLRRMLDDSLPDGVWQRIGIWSDNVAAWAHGEATPGWAPPEAFLIPRAIGDQHVPGPPPRNVPYSKVIDVYAEHLRQQSGPPPPEPWAGQDSRPAGGRIYAEIVREKYRAHAEDSER